MEKIGMRNTLMLQILDLLGMVSLARYVSILFIACTSYRMKVAQINGIEQLLGWAYEDMFLYVS